jgi:hypothetical protein
MGMGKSIWNHCTIVLQLDQLVYPSTAEMRRKNIFFENRNKTGYVTA